MGESRDQVYRYIRLTNLIPKLLKLVDERRIAFTLAVELSHLPEREQWVLYEEIEYADATPSLSRAQCLRRFSEQGRLSVDTIFVDSVGRLRSLSIYFPVIRLKSKLSKVLGAFIGNRLALSRKFTVEVSRLTTRYSKTLVTARTSALVILFCCTTIANSSAEKKE